MRLLLTLLLACPLFGYDFSLSIEGPHTAWPGYLTVLQVKSSLTEGTRAYVDYTVDAPGVAAFPRLVETCCGPAKAWQPADTYLAIRVAEGASGPREVVLTAVSGGVTKTAKFTLDIQPVPQPVSMQPVAYASKADVATWTQNMEQGRAACAGNTTTSESMAWYYDGQRVFQQLGDVTGADWKACADQSEAVYRGYVLQNGGKVPGYRVFPHGLYRDFVENGDSLSKDAVLALAQSSAFAAAQGGVSTVASRETAYLLNARRLANKLGATYSLDIPVALSIGHLTQWSETPRPYLQPFMAGLTMESLIGYYEDTQDPRIPAVIVKVLNVLWANYWHEPTQAFRYDDKATTGSPDLNMLVAPAFAWAYRITGEPIWAERGDQIFNGGLKAWLGGGKQFSQQYRWSPAYVSWMAKPADLPQEPVDSVSRAEFEAAVAALKAQLASLDDAVKALAEQGLTLEKLRERLR